MEKCKCGKEMNLAFCWDDAQQTDHAYNLYTCDCGLILKVDVWEDKGRRWVKLDGSLEIE